MRSNPRSIVAAAAVAVALALGAVGLTGGPGRAAPAAAPPAGDASQMVARGGEVYRTTCAMCHDNPTGRTPSRTVLRQGRNPEFVLRALTTGAMREIAAGLSLDDKKAVTAFVTGRAPRDVPDVDPKANMCRKAPPAMTLAGSAWNGWGGRGTTNARHQPDPGFTAAEVGRLKVKWVFALPDVIYNPPSVLGGRVFVGNMAGVVYSLDADTGCTYWFKDLATPTRTAVIVGRLPSGRFAAYVSDWWGNVLALDAETGTELWKIRPEEHRAVRLTGSPMLHDGRLYIPISSGEEGLAQDPNYVCCTFRGALVAVDAATGKTIWKTYTIDRPAVRVPGDSHRMGPAGAAIWSSPTIDTRRRLIYVATGDDYTDPATDASDAIIAYDLATGRKRWTNQVIANDRYVAGCEGETRTRNCPSGELGPDHDFGASPLLVRTSSGKEVIVALSKNGVAYGMDPDRGGRTLWQRRLGHGGMLGGIEWGASTDGTTIFVPISDYPYPGTPLEPVEGWPLSPSVSAITADAGAVRWRQPAPKVPCSWDGKCEHAFAAATISTPDLVFAGAWDGRERAYAAATGKLLWEYDTARSFAAVNGAKATGGTIDHGAHAVAGGTLFVTSGSRTGQRGNALIAFTVDGK